jgi:DNA helicase HerA-like ATPase
MGLYPNFGMKPTDAKAFTGNIRQITNARELIDVRKYMKPGEIQIFAVHKLDPKDIDTFVANTVREVFHANFDESEPLRLVLVYDEVHRLLPKFGGSGEGFLQIERACREFRKWGIGVVLISQVLADFVGQIKANINTEVQMRTRDEGDLERIKTK